MTFLSKVLLFFPASVLLLTGASIVYWVHSQSIFGLLAVLFSLYGFPLLVYRWHQYFYPVQEGISYLLSKDYSPWWGSHQIQAIYIAIPALEVVLRLIPGVFSWWLRLWGAKVGKNVYWTPGLEIADRGFIEIGDRVLVGHRVIMCSHIIKPRKQNLMLYLKKVKVGNDVFLGAGSHLGPGTEIGDRAYIEFQTTLYINEKVE